MRGGLVNMKKYISIFLSVLLASVEFMPLAQVYAQNRAMNLAVAKIDGSGMSQGESAQLTQAVLNSAIELTKSEKYRKSPSQPYNVSSRSDLQQYMSQIGNQRGRTAIGDDQAELMKKLGAEQVILGSASSSSGSYTIDLRLVDLSTGTTIASESKKSSGTLSRFMQKDVPDVVERLLYRENKKSSKLPWIIAGVAAAGAIAAILLSDDDDDGGPSGPGTITIEIPQ